MKLLLAAALFAAAAKPLPEPPHDYVHNEGVIGDADERALSERLAGIERESGMQFVVAIFQGLDGENLEDYSNKLFRHWKIGDAKRNDGLLFAMFIKERKWRVEVGYGLESRLPDAAAGQIARNEGVPQFQKIAYYAGARAVIDALYDRAKGKTQALPRRAQPIYHKPPLELTNDMFAILFLLMGLGTVAFVIWLSSKASRGGRYSSSGGSSYGDYSSYSSSSSSSSSYSGGGGSSGGGGASGSW